jgi:hypothetical protein
MFNYGFTDDNGNFDFYASVPSRDYVLKKDSAFISFKPDSVKLHFLDADGITNGYFEDKTLIINTSHNDEVKITVTLNEKP